MTLATHPFLRATLVEGLLALVTAEEVGSVRGCVMSGRGDLCALATLDRRWVEDGLVPQPPPSELDGGASFLRAPGTEPDPIRARRCRCSARVLHGGRMPVLLAEFLRFCSATSSVSGRWSWFSCPGLFAYRCCCSCLTGRPELYPVLTVWSGRG